MVLLGIRRGKEILPKNIATKTKENKFTNCRKGLKLSFNFNFYFEKTSPAFPIKETIIANKGNFQAFFFKVSTKNIARRPGTRRSVEIAKLHTKMR